MDSKDVNPCVTLLSYSEEEDDHNVFSFPLGLSSIQHANGMESWRQPPENNHQISACSSTCFHASRCLKITEKVSFNIASEASYIYILRGQKLFKNAKNGPIWRVFENFKLAAKQSYQTSQF